jgi:hypothetical protein
MMVMISANHLLTLYLGLELLSLSLYAMVALRPRLGAPTEAAMKYFVLGALASGLLLYGMSMVYGATGTLEFTRRAAHLRTRPRRTRRCWCSAWCSWSPAWLQARRGAVPHVGARRLSGRADRRHAADRHGAQAGRVRDGDAPAGRAACGGAGPSGSRC